MCQVPVSLCQQVVPALPPHSALPVVRAGAGVREHNTGSICGEQTMPHTSHQCVLCHSGSWVVTHITVVTLEIQML